MRVRVDLFSRTVSTLKFNTPVETLPFETVGWEIPEEGTKEEINEAIMKHVANNVEDQETYSMAMIDAASKGQVPVDAVLGDDSILPQFKDGLLNAVRANAANSGLGQIR